MLQNPPNEPSPVGVRGCGGHGGCYREERFAGPFTLRRRIAKGRNFTNFIPFFFCFFVLFVFVLLNAQI